MVLPITDAAWLQIEDRETPQHVGALMTFELPAGEDDSFVGQLYERFRTAGPVLEPFSNKLAQPYGRLGSFYSWTEDDAIDLDYHVRHSALPTPGRVRELLVLVSRLHSSLLDRHRPLWECHLIEGLEGGRFAIYTKVHHSMFDGVGAMRVMRAMLSTEEGQRDMPPPWTMDISGGKKVSLSTDGTQAASAEAVDPKRDLFAPLKAARTVGGALVAQRRERSAGTAGAVMPFSAPKSILNNKITGSRRFAADGYAFSRIKSVATAAEVTVNDVALAMSSHALREYLLDQNALPERPLTAMVPVSIRSEAEESRGNALSFLITDLGTDIADPYDRLHRISASMTAGKARLATMSRMELIGYALALTSPYLIGPMVGTAGHGRPVANVVISNVPGPREPRFFDGARMTGMYPASLLQEGQALNITLTSYVDEVQFGLTACRKTLPSVQRMLDHLEEGLVALEKASGAA